MTEEPEWRWQLALGLALVLQSFTNWSAPGGPWNDESFTRGVIALTGLGFLYTAEFRRRFRVAGVIPYLRLHRCEPEQISVRVGTGGALMLALTIVLGRLSLKGVSIPDAASLIALMLALLMFLYAAYAWLVISGPLAEFDEEE